MYRILYFSSSKKIQILKRHKTRQRFMLNAYNKKMISKIIKKTMNKLIKKKRIKKIKLMKKNEQKKSNIDRLNIEKTLEIRETIDDNFNLYNEI